MSTAGPDTVGTPLARRSGPRLPTSRRHIWWATGLSTVLVLVGTALVTFRGDEPLQVGLPLQLLVSYDLWAALYLLLTWRVLPRVNAAALHDWARQVHRAERRPLRDALLGRAVGFSIPLWGALYGFGAAVWALPQARALEPERAPWLVAASVASVVISWVLMHTAYAMHYAYLYYRSATPGGLDFPGDDDPAALDFTYFAVMVATTFGTTDVTIVTRRFRRVVTGHALLAFVFNTGVLALTLTVLVG